MALIGVAEKNYLMKIKEIERGRITMSFEETLKSYFERLIESDMAIRAVYDEEKIGTCASYVIAQAKKQTKGNCAVISDEVVFKWARDFYLGDIEKDWQYPKDNPAIKAQVMSGADDDETEEEITPKKEPKPKKAKVSKPDFEKEQLSLFEF